MKKILVPTDFSECSLEALAEAVMIAQKLGAEIHVYSRIHIHPNWDAMSETAKVNYPETFANIHDAKESFNQIQKTYASSGVPMEMSYSRGDLVDNVEHYIKNKGIDLVVMGSAGASGIKEWIIGSNTQKVVRASSVPVMVLKNGRRDESFQNIVFASDFRAEALKPFEWLLKFASFYSNAHIHLLHIDVPRFFAIPGLDYKGSVDDFTDMCGDMSYTVHNEIDTNVEDGIRKFASEIDADLIAIADYGESLLARMFTGSITEALVNHLDLPVLSLK